MGPIRRRVADRQDDSAPSCRMNCRSGANAAPTIRIGNVSFRGASARPKLEF
jgi:hypothetical protein